MKSKNIHKKLMKIMIYFRNNYNNYKITLIIWIKKKNFCKNKGN